MVQVVLIALASASVGIGLSLWLMLRKFFALGILLAAFLIPLTFMIGTGLEDHEARRTQTGNK